MTKLEFAWKIYEMEKGKSQEFNPFPTLVKSLMRYSKDRLRNLFIGSLIFIPIGRMGYQAKVNEYNAVKHTITAMRDGKSTHETDAMVLELTKINKDIANAQYWDGLLFGIYIPDAYTNLEYLK